MSASARTPTGTLIQKIHSHERASVRTPPSRTPAAAPKPPTAPQAPRAMFRSRPSWNVVVRIASAAGEMVAAPRPCSARAPISDASSHAYCPIAHALDLVGERWSLLVVRELTHGPQRYTDLHARLGCGTNVLAQRLRELEARGVLAKRRLPPPPRRRSTS